MPPLLRRSGYAKAKAAAEGCYSLNRKFLDVIVSLSKGGEKVVHAQGKGYGMCQFFNKFEPSFLIKSSERWLVNRIKMKFRKLTSKKSFIRKILLSKRFYLDS
jgi:hypothetical protein